MINLVDFLVEKLTINKDTQIEDTTHVTKPTSNGGTVKIPRIPYAQPADIKKMKMYHDKNSKPLTLVHTIKDKEKLLRRFGVAVDMDWKEAIRVFGNEIVLRGYFTREEIDAFIARYAKP